MSPGTVGRIETRSPLAFVLMTKPERDVSVRVMKV